MTTTLARKRWYRLILIVFIPFSLAFIDRANFGFALAGGMAEDLKSLFPNALYAGWGLGHHQVSQNLFADMYSQYAGTQPAFASHRYIINQQWVQAAWTGTYVNTMPSLVTIIKESSGSDLASLNAIARIWKVWVLHRATDYFGPIPYSKMGQYVQGEGVAYDSQKDIYYDFFKELQEATTVLKANLSQPSYGSKDLIYNGDNAKWLKFGNTLRLRLALRISGVEPTKAKAEAEAAFAGGVMENMGDAAFIQASSANINQFNQLSGWNEFRMSANMESVLVGYADPRLSVYFKPAKNDNKWRGASSAQDKMRLDSTPMIIPQM